jgi:hypothetical protein
MEGPSPPAAGGPGPGEVALVSPFQAGGAFARVVHASAVPVSPADFEAGISGGGCDINQSAVTSCLIKNFSSNGCPNYDVGCKVIQSQSAGKVNCNWAGAIAAAAKTIQDMNLSAAALARVVHVMSETGIDPTLPFATMLGQYMIQQCDSTQRSYQNVYAPDIILVPPDCDGATVSLIASLDQRTQCVLGNVQNLLYLADVNTGPPAPGPDPTSQPILLQPWVLGVIIAVGVVLLCVAIAGGVILHNKKHKPAAAPGMTEAVAAAVAAVNAANAAKAATAAVAASAHA